jgi:hypothetical protein
VNAQNLPAAVLLFKTSGQRPFRDFLLMEIAVQALAQTITFPSVVWAWRRRVGWRHLALSAPVLQTALARFDLVTVAITVAVCAPVERRDGPNGGFLVALGALVKV